jgi:uncharacterized protein YndB with AHSA1/START domain
LIKTIQIAPVKRSVVVAVNAKFAFEFYTARLDAWWPKSHSIGDAPLKKSVFEPFVGGRWYAIHDDGRQSVVGHVLVWQPGERVVHTWEINGEWKSDPRVEFTSEVEVRFIAEGPERTRVEVEHRHFERMGEAAGIAMHDAVGRGWPDLLELYAQALASAQAA